MREILFCLILFVGLFLLYRDITGMETANPTAVKAGHAHYDPKTGDIVWNSGNCNTVKP